MESISTEALILGWCQLIFFTNKCWKTMEQQLEFWQLGDERLLAQVLYPTKQLLKTFLYGTSKYTTR